MDDKYFTSFKGIAKWIVLIVFVFCVIVIIALILQFEYGFAIATSDLAKWGQVGDYIGGLLGTVIEIANLFFLGFVTLLLKNRDDKADAQHINTQKLLAINQLRYESVQELAKTLNQIPYSSPNNIHPTVIVIKNVQESYEVFTHMNQYLFQELFTKNFRDNYMMPLESTFRQLVMESTNANTTGQIRPQTERMAMLLINYYNHKNAFVNELNKYVFQEMSPK